MGIVIKQKVYELPDEGLHSATLTEVKDLGLQDTQFGPKDKIQIVFTVNDQVDSEGKPMQVSIFANKNLGEKATLTKVLKQLGFNPGLEFNTDLLIGINVQLVIVHNENAEGRVFANVGSILKSKAKKTVVTEEI